MTQIPSGLDLPDTEVLTALQDHMRKLCAHFGWVEEPERKFLLLVEEVGELAKALRRMEKFSQEAGKEMDAVQAQANLEEEFADIFSYLLDLANGYGVNLGEAYRQKVTRNFSRSWK